MSAASPLAFAGYAVLTSVAARPLGIGLVRRVGARSVLDPAHRTRLVTAFEALGTERVRLGLSACGHDWHDCFLAVAASGDAATKVRVLRRLGWTRHMRFLSALIDAPLGVVGEVVHVWDGNELAFRGFATEWLKQARAASAQAEVEAARPAERPAGRRAVRRVRRFAPQGV